MLWRPSGHVTGMGRGVRVGRGRCKGNGGGEKVQEEHQHQKPELDSAVTEVGPPCFVLNSHFPLSTAEGTTQRDTSGPLGRAVS